MSNQDSTDREIRREYMLQCIPSYGFFRSFHNMFRGRASLLLDFQFSDRMDLLAAYSIYHLVGSYHLGYTLGKIGRVVIESGLEKILG